MSAASGPPEGVHTYTTLEEVPTDLQKYWLQRNNIFSKYDEGIWLTDDAWFGVTPEPIAKKIAEHVATAPKEKKILIDAFAGAGGNVIAFALSGRWSQIFAVEKDAKTLACAKHNAEVYAVAKKIWWIHGDIFDVLKARLKASVKNAVIFASPPWGGPSYTDWDVFDLSYMEPYNLKVLYDAFSAANEVVLYLPRTSDVQQLAKYAKGDEKLPVTHYCMKGASKALCVFYGSFQVS
ncbi:Putative RNA cap guanine-N2 methyltransferase, S-adenosyl-L-methionine-dependent methyltransferase [Septoria linicola]|uniref:Trimethylguanosine synthase n=1 Tax=Septoria linicola TaxID=215465 RepID=A0A9Q9B1W3_9PEZI|nr:Putative RNA cap guanine-N2 methyltransferase, S-adenosyl-L-methionine-dependent methyltransferase [Septoria linicola]